MVSSCENNRMIGQNMKERRRQMKKLIAFVSVILLSLCTFITAFAAHSIALPTEHVVHDVAEATQNGVPIVVTIQPLAEEYIVTGESFVEAMADTTGIVHWLQVTHTGDTSSTATITFVTNLLQGTAVRIIHFHQGDWRVVPGHDSSIVGANGLLTVTFDHLSPVGLVVLSVPTDDGTSGDDTGNNDTANNDTTSDTTSNEEATRRSPQTGVNSHMGLAATGFIGAGIGLLVLVKSKK